MIQPPTEPVNLTPPEEALVVRTMARNLDEVAAIVGAHDGKSRAVISLEGTDFQVVLGPRRPLAKRDADLFKSARDWAVRELRALSKGMRRKVHPPRKVAPVAGEVESIRRQLAEAQGALSGARQDLASVRGELANQREAYNAAWSDLEAARAQRLEEKNEELEGRVRELETELEDAASEAAAQGHAEGREEVLLELGVHDDLTLADRLELEGLLSAFEERRRSVRPMTESVRAGEAGTESVVVELRARVDHLVTIVRTLTTASEGGPMDDETEDKALFLIMNWEDLPLAALRWVVEENRRP